MICGLGARNDKPPGALRPQGVCGAVVGVARAVRIIPAGELLEDVRDVSRRAEQRAGPPGARRAGRHRLGGPTTCRGSRPRLRARSRARARPRTALAGSEKVPLLSVAQRERLTPIGPQRAFPIGVRRSTSELGNRRALETRRAARLARSSSARRARDLERRAVREDRAVRHALPPRIARMASRIP